MSTHTLFPLAEISPGTARKVEVSLSEGFVEPDACMIECVRHGALFNLRTGEPESLPAVRPVPVYEVEIVVKSGEVRFGHLRPDAVRVFAAGGLQETDSVA